MSVIPRTTPAPAVERPPLLAPPVLAEPGPIAVVAVPASSVLIYAITVSALLGAAAVSIGALVHVRRSD